MKVTQLALLLGVFSCIQFSQSEVTCRDENGDPVDWFYMYKLPRNRYNKDPLIKLGKAYMYITPKTVKSGWILSKTSINGSTSMPALTLKPIYQNVNKLLTVIYNDQPATVSLAYSPDINDNDTLEITTPVPKRKKLRVKRQNPLLEKSKSTSDSGSISGSDHSTEDPSSKPELPKENSLPKYPSIPRKDPILKIPVPQEDNEDPFVATEPPPEPPVAPEKEFLIKQNLLPSIEYLPSDAVCKKAKEMRAFARRVMRNRKAGKGHTKGVVMSDGVNGVWLIHSVPKFPPSPTVENTTKYSYPRTAYKYGQSFLCITIKAADVDTIGHQLTFNEPRIVYSHVPNEWVNEYPNIINVIYNLTVIIPPWTNKVSFKSKRGTKFWSFAKSGNFQDDLYEAFVAESIEADLLTETWINGPGVLSSNCSRDFSVNNIDKIKFPNKDISFSSHVDHSKWAISVPENSTCPKGHCDRWLCVGDINRAAAQLQRGGGTVCILNRYLWSIYESTVNSVEPCSTS